jgi:hypothetical protein
MEMTETTKAVLTPTTADLLAAYGVQEDEETTFEITLPKGEKLKAKALTDASQIMNIEAFARQMQKLCKMGGTQELAPFLPASPEIIRFCVYAEACLIEPNKMTFAEALKLAKHCGFLMVQIGNELTIKVKNLLTEAELAKIEDAKND